MTTLILIRHGETDWNIEGRYTGQSDIPLNARGLQQAEALSLKLCEKKIDAIFSSDLLRASQTAQRMRADSDTPLHLDPRLREIDQGEWEGLHFDEIRTRYREAWEKRKNAPLEVAPPGGETVGEVRQRVLEAVREIIDRHPQETVAIVSHGLVLAIIQVETHGLPIESVWDHIPSNANPKFLTVENL
jgi:alpha-ribazole phosphatase